MRESFEITRLFPSGPGERGEARRAAALRRAEAQHNECGGRRTTTEPAKRLPGKQRPVDRSQAQTHTNPAAHLWLFKKAI